MSFLSAAVRYSVYFAVTNAGESFHVLAYMDGIHAEPATDTEAVQLVQQAHSAPMDIDYTLHDDGSTDLQAGQLRPLRAGDLLSVRRGPHWLGLSRVEADGSTTRVNSEDFDTRKPHLTPAATLQAEAAAAELEMLRSRHAHA